MLSLVLPCLAALAAGTTPVPSALAGSVQDSVHLVLVATTDVHGHATAWNYLTGKPYPGGLARVARVVDSLRDRYPGRVLLVDAGDLIQGDPFAEYFARVAPRDPNPIIDAMNLMGYDAATIGNHDFDFGLDVMWRSFAGAAFPYVSANIFRGETLALPPTTVVVRQGVRVAFTGFTTPGVMVWSRRLLDGRGRVERIIERAGPALADARRTADLSVVLIHSGLGGPSAYDTTGVGGEQVAARLAGVNPRPDLVVMGHSHREVIDTVINGVHFVQPGAFARSVAVVHIDMIRRRSGWRVGALRAEQIDLARVEPDRRVEQRLWSDHQAVMVWVASPLGRAAGDMPARLGRAQPTPIINFVNEVQRRRTGAQLSATSAFDPAAGFSQGEIRLADVAALYPYSNTLRAVRISGADLREYLEQSARYFRVADGRVVLNDSIPGYNFDIVAGARYRIDLSRRPGSRISELSVDGLPVAAEDSFTMALNSYRQSGGGGYRMVARAPVVYDRGESVRDVLVEAIRSRGVIDPADYAAADWSIDPPGARAAVRHLFLDPQENGALTGPAVRILAINDLAGVLVGPAGDSPVAALKTTMDSVAAACECVTLRLSAGNQLAGTLLSDIAHGRATVAALNRLGIDGAALGPGDLAWPLDTLEHRVHEADFPWVTANLLDRTGAARPVWLSASIILDAGSHRLGVLGYLSPTLGATARSEDLGKLEIVPGAASVIHLADVARERGADLVVLLAQAGGSCDPTCDGDLFDLARGVAGRGVDLILAGGPGGMVDTVVAGVPVARAAGGGSGLVVADLIESSSGSRWRTGLVSPPSDVVPDDSMTMMLEPYRRAADSLAHRVVARIRLPLPLKDGPSSLRRLVADAFRNVRRSDIALVPGSMLGSGLEAGAASYGDLLRVLPQHRQVVTTRLTGAEVRRIIEQALAAGFPALQVSGVFVRYDPGRDAGKRVRELRLLDGRKIRGKDTYSVAIPDIMLQRSEWAMDTRTAEPGVLDADALSLYLSRLPQPVEPPGTRWYQPED